MRFRRATLLAMTLLFLLGLAIGVGSAIPGPADFSLGGWLTGAVLIGFGFVGRAKVVREEMSGSS